jgi:hypothetical protein
VFCNLFKSLLELSLEPIDRYTQFFSSGENQIANARQTFINELKTFILLVDRDKLFIHWSTCTTRQKKKKNDYPLIDAVDAEGLVLVSFSHQSVRQIVQRREEFTFTFLRKNDRTFFQVIVVVVVVAAGLVRVATLAVQWILTNMKVMQRRVTNRADVLRRKRPDR